MLRWVAYLQSEGSQSHGGRAQPPPHSQRAPARPCLLLPPPPHTSHRPTTTSSSKRRRIGPSAATTGRWLAEATPYPSMRVVVGSSCCYLGGGGGGACAALLAVLGVPVVLDLVVGAARQQLGDVGPTACIHHRQASKPGRGTTTTRQQT